MKKISGRVIGGIPAKGRLGEVRKRGILRVVLPPAEPPFQYLIPTLRTPAGFTPALVYEIAALLDVKANVTIFDPENPQGKANGSKSSDFDVAVVNDTGSCGKAKEIPFFYTGKGSGWKRFCVAGPGDELSEAVERILTYFNETGIFTQLYMTYVKP